MSLSIKIRHCISCALPYRIRVFIKSCLSKYKAKKNNSIESKLEELRDIIIYNHPIDQVPKATGKLRLLQEGNAVLLKVFAEKCESQGLRYWLGYGTLLGAIRHKGFIPWDDDLDVCMLDSDYKRLNELIPQLFPEEEGFTCSRHAFLHIGFRNTPLNIDIFPYFIHSQVANEPNKQQLLKSLTEIGKKIVFTQGLLNITDNDQDILLKHHVYKGKMPLNECENPLIFLAPNASISGYEAFEYNDIFPLKKAIFEGTLYTVPNKTRKHLSYLFGDYMSYPPKVGIWHNHVAKMVKETPYEDAVNDFIDRYTSTY